MKEEYLNKREDYLTDFKNINKNINYKLFGTLLINGNVSAFDFESYLFSFNDFSKEKESEKKFLFEV